MLTSNILEIALRARTTDVSYLIWRTEGKAATSYQGSSYFLSQDSVIWWMAVFAVTMSWIICKYLFKIYSPKAVRAETWTSHYISKNHIFTERQILPLHPIVTRIGVAWFFILQFRFWREKHSKQCFFHEVFS